MLDPEVLLRVDTAKGEVILNPNTLMVVARKIEDSQAWVNPRNHGIPHRTLMALLGVILPRPDDGSQDQLWGVYEWLRTNWLVPYQNADDTTHYWIPREEGWRPFDDKFDRVKAEVLAELTKGEQSLSHLVKATSGSKDYIRRVLAQLGENGDGVVSVTKTKGRYGTYQNYALVGDGS